jgi:hypothetical protein
MKPYLALVTASRRYVVDTPPFDAPDVLAYMRLTPALSLVGPEGPVYVLCSAITALETVALGVEPTVYELRYAKR